MILAAARVKNGSQFETTFKPNPRPDSPYPLLASTINGQPAGKAILSRDVRIEPGVLYRVRAVSIQKPRSKGHGAIIVEYVCPLGDLVTENLYVDPVVEAKILALLEEGRNILLDGPQGSGKTVLSRAIAAALGMEYVFFNCSCVYEATEFLASLQLKAGAGNAPETVWVPTDILRCLENARENPHKRYLIFLDELNRMRDMARNGIMPALDSTRKLFNPLTGTTLNIPANVFWIAAVNNGSQFTGASVVDPAQLDRFSPVKIGYPPPAEEIRLLRAGRPALSGRIAARIVEAANAVRGNQELGLDLSVRATEEAAALMTNPRTAWLGKDPLLEILKTTFCGRLVGSWDDPGTDAGMAWGAIQRALTKPDLEESGDADGPS